METSTFPCVGEVMSAPVVVVRDYDSIWHAIDRFVTTGLHHLAVVDNGDRLVGVLDDRQALAEWPFEAVGMHCRTIGELVRSRTAGRANPTARVHPSVTLRIAGRLMLEQHVDALAVCDEFGRAVGILTGSDLIGSLVNNLDQPTITDGPK